MSYRSRSAGAPWSENTPSPGWRLQRCPQGYLHQLDWPVPVAPGTARISLTKAPLRWEGCLQIAGVGLLPKFGWYSVRLRCAIGTRHCLWSGGRFPCSPLSFPPVGEIGWSCLLQQRQKISSPNRWSSSWPSYGVWSIRGCCNAPCNLAAAPPIFGCW